FKVEFDNCSSVDIVNNHNNPEPKNNTNSNSEKINLEIISLTPNQKTLNFNVNFSIAGLEYLIPEINRINFKYWHNFTTGEILSLDDVLEHFDHFLPPAIDNFPRDEPEWLKELKSNIDVRFIESQRLLNFLSSRSSVSLSNKGLSQNLFPHFNCVTPLVA
ncbi:MAG: hypothetical protein F6K47_31100, partial [Symploca sp. SIO2E6]|nr:hypothetical protein [Symploca sp. SIO2E6]